jgi:2-polyprenyl-3-methyl-5-hydroxy-6-metoxy-1,4-benzoquinol methylase
MASLKYEGQSTKDQTRRAVQGTDRPANYYTQARPEVAALVSPHCHRVLEIGCGLGVLGASLRARGHHVTGVELIPEIAAQAETRLDAVVCADVEAGRLPFAPRSFDAIILADVLEHLVDPWTVLRDCVELLAPGGQVIVSVPNVQNIDVIRRLIRGRWDYRERGILDRGHLRFFTLRSVKQLFAYAGLTIDGVEYRYRRSLLRGLMCAASFGAAQAFLTRQFLVAGHR